MRKQDKNSEISPAFLKRMGSSTIITLIFVISAAFMPGLPSFPQEDGKIEEVKDFKEKVTVTARLPEDEESLSKTPAHVTVLTSEDIRNSGAGNIQELLSGQAGIIFYDDIGNGVETTIDIRGFNEGTAAAVLLDGVRINEPDDNRVNLEQIPLSSIERIEIYRGSSSSTFGAGALSGTVNIVTKKSSQADFLEMRASYGSYKSGRGGISGGFHAGNFGYFVDLSRDVSDGFRENGESALSNLFFKAETSTKSAGSFSLSFLRNQGHFGAPGSLTGEELETDPYASPFNKVDGCDERLNLVTLRMDKDFNNENRFSANLFFRENSIDTLTTGRWLIGFETSSHLESSGLITQYDAQIPMGQSRISLATGIETEWSRFSSDGYFTGPSGEPFSPLPDSSNETDLRKAGIFSQASGDISKIVSLLAGARFDHVHLDYNDLLLPQGEGTTTFSETSFKGGVNINPSEKTGYYALYSEAFLPPTVYDLYAFPLFGSNPDLKPSRAKNYELGMRKRWGDILMANLSLFRIDVEDEVVFVMTDPATFTGRNENVGKSRRRGIELSSEFHFSEAVSASLHYSFLDAELRSGENRGKRIPLVPEHKAHAGLTAKWGKNKDHLFSLTVLSVGSQYLTGDDANTMERLDPYTITNARISKEFKKVLFFVEGKNLLGKRYATRGITNGFDLFYTPASGRTLYAGLQLRMDLSH